MRQITQKLNRFWEKSDAQAKYLSGGPIQIDDPPL